MRGKLLCRCLLSRCPDTIETRTAQFWKSGSVLVYSDVLSAIVRRSWLQDADFVV